MTDSSDFWSDDHLKRKDEANYLTKYLAARYVAKKNEQGFVLAVNGDWGLGKSFMIERWSKELEFAGHPVVMFNSWENDFTPEPLIAFIAELNSAMASQFDSLPLGEKLREKWLLQAKAVLIPALKVVGMAALKHGAGIGLHEVQILFGGEDLDDSEEEKDGVGVSLKDTAEKLSKVIEEELKSHTNVKHAIRNFKVRLSALVDYLDKQGGIQLPIFVFIDELDRCRPDYAIKLLEGVKHLFGVPGIHFIVATNLSELGKR
jgi:predicted KAP-like P-loop ATPase